MFLCVGGLKITLITGDKVAINPLLSLPGVKRRSNPLELQNVVRLPRFARNDNVFIFQLFTMAS